VGIATSTAPTRTLEVGSNLYVEDAGSNVLTVDGNIAATNITIGDVTIVASQGLDHVTNENNTTTQVVQFNHPTTGFVTAANAVIGGTLSLQNFALSQSYGLENVTDVNNTTGDTIVSSNATTGFQSTANISVGRDAIISGNVSIGGIMTMGTVNVVARHSLQGVTDMGNTTTHTIQFTNPTTSLVATGNVETQGKFIGDGSALTGISSTLQAITDSGNVTSNTIQFSNAITGFVTTANIEVGTANLFVDTVNSRVGIGTSNPEVPLNVVGNNALSGNPNNAIASFRATTAVPGTNDAGVVIGSLNGNSPYIADVSTASVGLSFYTQNAHRMRIDQNGNVGIGTTDPRNLLELKTTGSTTDDSALILLYKTTGNGVGIDFCDQESFLQKGYMRYHHINTQSFGVGNCFRFSSTESSETLALGGCLHIGVDGKDDGYMTNSTGSGRRNLFIQSTYNGNTSQNYGWWIGAQNQALSSTDNDLYFGVLRNGTINVPAIIQDDKTSATIMNFTGQHRTFVKDTPTNQLDDKEGLIVVSDQNEFIKMSGGVAYGNDAITINESLPLVSLSTKAKDKRCFGVLSTTEDPETRKEVHGNFASLMQKEEGDTRVYVNSVGEGAIWVTDTNGTLESGDYITTSNVAGYGMKQDDDILHNYTVAKILMDCDFNHQMDVRKEDPEKDTFVYEQREEMVNVLDEHGEFQWEETGETEKAYTLRYLDADGNITDEANVVHTAAFVGCTYHCG
jgi:hypothetical protein